MPNKLANLVFAEQIQREFHRAVATQRNNRERILSTKRAAWNNLLSQVFRKLDTFKPVFWPG